VDHDFDKYVEGVATVVLTALITAVVIGVVLGLSILVADGCNLPTPYGTPGTNPCTGVVRMQCVSP
jgi:hypothetical protein